MKSQTVRSDVRVVEISPKPPEPPLLLGDSLVIDQLRRDIESAGRSDAKVLILGETGVGKEIVARLVHHGGARWDRPFLAINCAGIPDSLLESELFGHVRGSFTDAYRDKPGLASLADGGTLFLDEVGEMSPRMQSMLLRFLETGELHRLGSERIDQRVDVRIVAATNRNLRDRITSGEFREDLYYRLNVAHITVPPLRERGADVLLLFHHYFDQYCRQQPFPTPLLTEAVKDLLLRYRWPGNVRELKNVAERIAVRRPHSPVAPGVLPVELHAAQTAAPNAEEPRHAARRASAADTAWNEMITSGENFWNAVHTPFMGRELTKKDVRSILRRGLTTTEGSYKKLTELFHLPASDYKRLLSFLYQHDCHLPVHPFRERTTAHSEPD
jgi:two-component system, NtrC family, response regulator AtoC